MPRKSPLLVLCDANALIHRAYHAIPPLTSASGEPTNATFGFASTLLKTWHDFSPDYVALAFDVGRTFRHEEYAEYKAQREKAPDDLIVQLQRAQDVGKAFGVAVYTAPGYEADDILATLSAQAQAQKLDVIIVTGDSDTLQLVTPQIQVYMVGRKFSEGMLYNTEAVQERYGLAPAQLIDYKGLAGDTSDNIPGVSGIGEKTATRLLQSFGSIEGIYEHLGEIETRWQQKLAAERDLAFQSKHLATLVKDAPVTLDLNAARAANLDRQRVTKLFRELGFFSLLARLPGETPPQAQGQLSLFGEGEAPSAAASTAAAPSGDYQIVDTAAALDALIQELRQAGAFALDAETTGLDPLQSDIVGLAIADKPGAGYYIPLGHDGDKGQSLPLSLARQKLGPLLADESIRKYAHNANFDLMVLSEAGMPVRGLTFDTLIAAFLCDPSRNLGLKQLAFERFGVEMTPIAALIGKGSSSVTMARVEVTQAAPYAAADADMTLRLVEPLRREMDEKQLTRLYEQVELPLVPVLLEMERAGVALDVAFLREMSASLAQQLGDLETRIYEAVGHPFNINSTKQLADVLFGELRLPAPRRTQTGFSTDASVMEELKGAHPVVDALIEYRQLAKIRSTYVDALPALINPRTGRVHTSYNQTGAITGRLSSSNPNLQNIPIRTELGREVRQAFIAPSGSFLLEADYSQVELRILAHIAGDQALQQAFWRGEDIHASTAASIMGVGLPEVTPDMRRLAKSINFGIVYGMSDFGLAARTGLSQAEASRFISNYFGKYPKVREYLEQTKNKARQDGYVETLLGRRRYFPELAASSRANPNAKRAAERMAINMPIQGTAADIIKLAMIKMAQMIQHDPLKSKMILQVHDELVFEIPADELEQMKARVREVMEGIYPLAVPLKVEMHSGHDWGHMG